MQQTIHLHQIHIFNRPLLKKNKKYEFIILSTLLLLENMQKLVIVFKIV